jgi:O-antigen ligase
MKNFTATKAYALAFGLFLGLCIWKFGNPVILEHKISAPATPSEFLNEPWPPHWANWTLLPLAIIGGLIILKKRSFGHSAKSEIGNRKSEIKWLWLLPLAWLGWQFFSATQTVDADLTTATLWQFSGCVACYFLGARLLNERTVQNYLWVGLLAAFAFCLIRAVDQRLFEFPANHQILIEGERTGWTNFPPDSVAEMKQNNIIISTNGVDVANPVFLEKFQKGRVAGTMVYPNALAGIILLLWPAALTLVFETTKKLKLAIRWAAMALVIFLGSGAFYWSGSKLGWLIGVILVGIWLFRLEWPRHFKFAAVAVILIIGLGIFAIRFHHYFATGSHSASARLDYWQAAARTAVAHPLFGTGPGTFQRPYAQIKSPESEMARLAHNDYLEQFCDSGIVGGLTYGLWIIIAIIQIWKTTWKMSDELAVALLLGLLGWFVQGLGEFALYIPATAWTAFLLLGGLLNILGLDSTKSPPFARLAV